MGMKIYVSRKAATTSTAAKRARSCFQTITPILRRFTRQLGYKTLFMGQGLDNLSVYTKTVINWLSPWTIKDLPTSQDVPRLIARETTPSTPTCLCPSPPTSVYSLASSRTKSTEYGIFFRRMAISETISEVQSEAEEVSKHITDIPVHVRAFQARPAIPTSVSEQILRPNSPVYALRPLGQGGKIMKPNLPNSVSL